MSSTSRRIHASRMAAADQAHAAGGWTARLHRRQRRSPRAKPLRRRDQLAHSRADSILALVNSAVAISRVAAAYTLCSRRAECMLCAVCGVAGTMCWGDGSSTHLEVRAWAIVTVR